MATVPTYQPGQVSGQETRTGQLNINAPLDAFKGGNAPQIAASVANAADNVSDAFLQYKIQADEVRVTEMSSRALAITNDQTFNPATGFMSKKGKNALNISAEYIPKFNEQMDAIENELNDDRQRSMFRARRSRYALKFQADLEKHESAQFAAYDKEATQAGIEASKDSAILNYMDTGAVTQSVADIKGVITNFANRNGMPDDWTSNEIKKNVGEAHIGIIDRMINMDEPEKAREHFNLYKGDLSGKDTERLEATLNKGFLRKESQVVSDRILGQGLTMSGALSQARRIEKGELRDEVTRRVKDRYGEIAEARRVQDEINVDATREQLARNGGNLDEAVDPVTLASWKPEVQKDLAIQASHIKSGRPFVTNDGVRYDLEIMAASNPSKFKDIDLQGQFGSKLSTGDAEYLTKLQTAAVRKGTAEGGDMMNDLKQRQQAFDQVLREFKMDPKDVEKPKIAALYGKMQDSINEWQRTNNKKASVKDMRDIMSAYLAEGVRTEPNYLKSFFYGTPIGTSDKLYKIENKEDYSVPYENIPSLVREEIEKKLISSGRTSSPANVEAAFKIRSQQIRGNK